jgi:DNA-directed RNA polymerase beta' subunit
LKITLDVLKNAKDSELEDVIDDFIFARKISKDMNNEYEIVKKLPKAMQWFHATFQLENEVNNGGFSQFFANSSGEFIKEAIEGCRVFGAKELTEIVLEAEKLNVKQKEMEKEGKEFDEEKYDKIDNKFFKLKINLNGLRIKYIRSHPEEFVCD